MPAVLNHRIQKASINHCKVRSWIAWDVKHCDSSKQKLTHCVTNIFTHRAKPSISLLASVNHIDYVVQNWLVIGWEASCAYRESVFFWQCLFPKADWSAVKFLCRVDWQLK